MFQMNVQLIKHKKNFTSLLELRLELDFDKSSELPSTDDSDELISMKAFTFGSLYELGQ